MTQKRKIKIEFIGVMVLMLLVSGICMLPCFERGLPFGDDQQVHMLRVESLLKALKSGQGYPVYVYQNMLEGYGYGMGMFYPDLFLLPAVFFRLLGAPPEIAMKLYIYVLFLCTCVTSYYAGKTLGGRKITGAVTMILYTMGHYHLEDVYIRFALGEVTAMIFIPLVFVSLYDFTEKQHSRRGLLCVTFSGLLLSHTISFALCVILAIIWCLLRYRQLLTNRHLIIELIAEAGVCMLITCYYWLPVAEQFLDGRFQVSDDPAFYTHENTMYLLAIVSGKYSVAFIEVGLLALLVFGGILNNIHSKKATWCLIGTVILLLLETNIFPWRIVDKTHLVSIQFPWRLNMLTEFMLAFGIAAQLCIVLRLYMNDIRCAVVGLVVCMLTGFFNLNMIWNVELGSYVDYPEGYADAVEHTNTVGMGEWLPEECDLADTVYADHNGVVRCGNRYIQGRYNADWSLEFDADGKPGEYIVPKYYYKGYKAKCVDAEGNTYDVDVQKGSEDGLIKLKVNSEIERVVVVYRGTKMQLVSRIITLLACAVIGVYVYIFFIRFNIKKTYDMINRTNY